MESSSLTCKACGYKMRVPFERTMKSRWKIYESPGGIAFPLFTDTIWCSECEAVVFAESHISPEAVETRLAEFAAEAAAFRALELPPLSNPDLPRVHNRFSIWCDNCEYADKAKEEIKSDPCNGDIYGEDMLKEFAALPVGVRLRKDGANLADCYARFVSWCSEHDDKKFVASWPSVDEIKCYGTDESVSRREKLDEINVNADLALLFERIVASAPTWLAFSKARRRPRCLSCGSQDLMAINARKADGKDHAYRLPHGSCKEPLLYETEDDGLRILWKDPWAIQQDTKIDVWRYTTLGFFAGDKLEGLKKDYPEVVPLVESVTRDEIAKRTGARSNAPVDGEDEFPALSLGLRKFVAGEMANSWHPHDEGTIWSDFPEVYRLIRRYVREEIAKVVDNAERRGNDPGGDERSEKSIHRTAFWILGATTRDDNRRIVELAEERALHLDYDVCRNARSDLTNPRTRLSVEMAWMPGVSPKKARDAAEALLTNPRFGVEQKAFPTLTRTNLMACAFETLDGSDSPSDVADLVLKLAHVAEDLDAGEVLRDLNEDRAVSGFPPVKNVEDVQAELRERLRFYKGAIRDALNTMPPDRLVETMTKAATVGTNGGESHAPALLDELVDAYEKETQGFLSKEAENVSVLVAKARDVAAGGEEVVGRVLDRIEKVVRNWDRVAQPIQTSMKARGIVHRRSQTMAYEVRDLGGDLLRLHDMMGSARRIVNFLAEVFDELPEVAELLERDSDSLDNVVERESNAKEERIRWEKEIAFHEEIGLVFKGTLSISPAGIQWKGVGFPLESVTRVMWGGIRNYQNGVLRHTEYTVVFGDNHDEARFQTKNESLYGRFVDKLWPAVCTRLMTDLLRAMRDGKRFACGQAIVDDTGVELWDRPLRSDDKRVYCKWSEVTIGSANGAFVITNKDDKKIDASASYISDANAHLFEHLITLNFKGADPRLSDALKGG